MLNESAGRTVDEFLEKLRRSPRIASNFLLPDLVAHAQDKIAKPYQGASLVLVYSLHKARYTLVDAVGNHAHIEIRSSRYATLVVRAFGACSVNGTIAISPTICLKKTCVRDARWHRCGTPIFFVKESYGSRR